MVVRISVEVAAVVIGADLVLYSLQSTIAAMKAAREAYDSNLIIPQHSKKINAP
jgi:hypothetical protein